MNCPNCHGTLELAGQGQHARCEKCGQLYSHQDGQLTPVVVQAPGGGYNAEFQALFEQQLGFGPRAHAGVGTTASNPIAKTIRMVVFGIVAVVFVVVGVIVYSSLT